MGNQSKGQPTESNIMVLMLAVIFASVALIVFGTQDNNIGYVLAGVLILVFMTYSILNIKKP